MCLTTQLGLVGANGKDPAGHANHFHNMATELIGTGEIIDDETWSFVREELKTGWQAQAALVAGRQARIAQANDRLESAWIEGLGQHVASIDSFAYADWERRNPGITGDKDWLHGLLRDNPECRVKSVSPKTQVSFAGLDFNPSEPSAVFPEAGGQRPDGVAAVYDRRCLSTETPSDRNTETPALAS